MRLLPVFLPMFGVYTVTFDQTPEGHQTQTLAPAPFAHGHYFADLDTAKHAMDMLSAADGMGETCMVVIHELRTVEAGNFDYKMYDGNEPILAPGASRQ